MADTNITQPSFSSGIISTELFGRIDFSKITSGLKQCRNWVIRPAGGAIYRVGTKYIAETKYPLKNVSLIPFVYNRQDGLCLEFGEKYIRFYKDGKQIRKLDVAYELETPYLASEVSQVKYTQYKNKMYLVHPNHRPKILERIADDDWKITDIEFNPSVPVVTDVKLVKGSAHEGGGSVKVDYDNWQYAVSVINKEGEESLPVYSNKLTSDIDLLRQNLNVTFNRPADYSNIKEYNIYRIKGGKFFYCYTIPYEDKASLTFKDISFALDETKTPKITFEEFSEGNYPAAVGFWQQRLVLANTKKKPSTFWMSRVGEPEDFTRTDYGSADDAIELTFNSGSVDAITDIVPMDDLIVFTQGKIWRVTGTSLKNMSAYIESYSGSSGLRPFATKKSILYVDSSENTVSNFVYSYELNGYSGQNLDILARDLMDGYKIEDVSYRDTPYGVMYSVRNDGVLLGLTYLREENIYAWHEHTTKDGKFRNVCSLDRNTNDDVYVAVERYGKTYIEKFGDYINNVQNIDDSWHLDCATRAVSDYAKWSNTETIQNTTIYKCYKTDAVDWYCFSTWNIPAATVHYYTPVYSKSINGGDWYADKSWPDDPLVAGYAKSPDDLIPASVFSDPQFHHDRLPEHDFEAPKIKTIYIIESISGAKVYSKEGGEFVEIGRLNSYTEDTVTFGGFRFLPHPDENVSRTENIENTTNLYTIGKPEIGGKAFIDEGLVDFVIIQEVGENTITAEGKIYTFEEGGIDSIASVSGLERFNGKTVTALIDTNVYDDIEVNNGTAFLPVSGKNVLIGLPYEGVMETIPQEMKFKSGSSTVGADRKTCDGVISYQRSRGLWYGVNYEHLYEIKPYTQETYSLNIPLESGKLILKTADGYSLDKSFFVVQRSPLPALIQSITLGINYNDKN